MSWPEKLANDILLLFSFIFIKIKYIHVKNRIKAKNERYGVQDHSYY
jgi:hypothetical protein